MRFSAKIAGAVVETTNLATVARWRKEGQLVLCKPSSGLGWVREMVMVRGDHKKKIRLGRAETVDEILHWTEKGYEIYREEKKQEERSLDKFQDVLQSVADVLEEHHAKKSAYFRNAVPYPYGQLMVVDFPTRSKQLKRTQEEFEAAGKPTAIRTLYHGTQLRLIPSIVKRGLRRSRHGMLGPGIYLGPIHKAKRYTDLIILECKVILGKCKELTKVEKFGKGMSGDYDSMHASRGPLPGVYKGFLQNEEWVVRYPKQVEISRLVCSVNGGRYG